MGLLDKLFSRSARTPLPTLEELFEARQLPLDLPGLETLIHEFEHMTAGDRESWADALASLHARGHALPMSWDDAQYELLPQVVPTWRAEREGFWYRPKLEGLSERILVAGAPMDEAWLDVWGVRIEDIMDRAMDHLREVSKGKPFQRLATGIYQSTFGDGLDASRILMPELWQDLFPGQNTFVVIPRQDTLLVAPQVLLPKLVEAVQAALEPGDQRVLGVLWQRVGTTILPASLQDPHPIAQPQRELRQADLMESYRIQDGDLNPAEGVPAVLTLLRTQQGRTVSTALWTEGKPVLLPDCDAVGFVNAKNQPLGIFHRQTLPRITELKGTPVDIWGPRRMRYEGFPTQEQLERLEVFATAEQMVQIFSPKGAQQGRPAPAAPRQDPAASGNMSSSSSPVPAHLRGQSLGPQTED